MFSIVLERKVLTSDWDSPKREQVIEVFIFGEPIIRFDIEISATKYGYQVLR